MKSEKEIEGIAAKLRAAYHAKPISSLRGTVEATDADSAYGIQNTNTRYWSEAGRDIIGCKVGLTAKSVQAQLGVDQPDYGILFSDMKIKNGGRLDPKKVMQPKVEAEIAIVLSKDINEDVVTREILEDSIREICVAIEIVDSRIKDWHITFADTVADNGSSAYFVLGEAPLKFPGPDLWSCGMVMELNGEVCSLGAGAACLGHPLKSALWVANTLLSNGHRLRAGDVILTGALGPMVALTPEVHVKATVGGIGSAEFYYGKG